VRWTAASIPPCRPRSDHDRGGTVVERGRVRVLLVDQPRGHNGLHQQRVPDPAGGDHLLRHGELRHERIAGRLCLHGETTRRQADPAAQRARQVAEQVLRHGGVREQEIDLRRRSPDSPRRPQCPRRSCRPAAPRSSRHGRHAGEHVAAAARAIYNHAIADDLIDHKHSPAHRVTKPRRLPSTRRALTVGELKQSTPPGNYTHPRRTPPTPTNRNSLPPQKSTHHPTSRP
jgi:hypothetical protein